MLRFYGLLALFPAISAVLAIGGLLVEPNQIINQLLALSDIVPEAVMNIMTAQATEVAGSREGGLGLAALVGIALASYSASLTQQQMSKALWPKFFSL